MSFCLINKNNFIHNVKQFTKIIPKEKIAVGLKTNAYGHGIKQISSMAREYGIKHVFVKNMEEALLVQNMFESVLVLLDIPVQKPQENINIAINSLESILEIPQLTSVELKVDTGMHRNGILPDQIHEALRLIKSKNLKLKGVFTHFASADENNESVFLQKNVFDKIRSSLLEKINGEYIRFHCSNSASVFRFDNTTYDLVRIGIGVYGYLELEPPLKAPELKPVLSLWAEKISTRRLEESESVGYGGAYVTNKSMTVSVYDTGYGDGVLRLNETKKSTIEDGKPILGRVSMDSFSTTGDDGQVCVFSDARRFAKVHDTNVYEIFVRLSPQIRRIIV